MADQPLAIPETFAHEFRDVIRVGFNWERFFKQRWPVEPVVLKSDDDLERCFLPWYIGPHGEELAYDAAGAVPMSLTDVPKAMALLNRERQDDIRQYVETFRNQGGVIEFATPTYGLPDNGHFVLDGNHRLSALTLNSVRFRVTLWNVRGPLDPKCLLDLIHWLPKPAEGAESAPRE